MYLYSHRHMASFFGPSPAPFQGLKSRASAPFVERRKGARSRRRAGDAREGRTKKDSPNHHRTPQKDRHPTTPSDEHQDRHPVGAVRERPKHREGSEAPFAKRKTPLTKPPACPHPDHQLKTSINHQQTPSPARRERAGARARGGAGPEGLPQPPPHPTRIPKQPPTKSQKSPSKSQESQFRQTTKIIPIIPNHANHGSKQRIPQQTIPATHVLRNLKNLFRKHLTTPTSVLHLWLRMNSDMRRDDGCGNPSPRGHRG